MTKENHYRCPKGVVEGDIDPGRSCNDSFQCGIYNACLKCYYIWREENRERISKEEGLTKKL